MKVLFLESRAARQIHEWVEENDVDERLGKLLEAAYNNGHEYFMAKKKLGYRSLQGISYEDWWVQLCLEGDRHKNISVNELMEWINTPEGQDFWSRVNAKKGAE